MAIPAKNLESLSVVMNAKESLLFVPTLKAKAEEAISYFFPSVREDQHA